MIAAHGRYLVRGGPVEVMEGEPNRVAVLEFPTLEAARGFCHSADAPLVALRRAASTAHIALVDGVAA